jgi:hypothetical protein
VAGDRCRPAVVKGGEPMKESCRTCHYWFSHRTDPKWRERDDRAQCRHYAPVPCTAEDARELLEAEATWPITLAEDWCGEWAPR